MVDIKSHTCVRRRILKQVIINLSRCDSNDIGYLKCNYSTVVRRNLLSARDMSIYIYIYRRFQPRIIAAHDSSPLTMSNAGSDSSSLLELVRICWDTRVAYPSFSIIPIKVDTSLRTLSEHKEKSWFLPVPSKCI